MLTKKQLNDNLLRAEYAVRGPIVLRAQQLEEQGRRISYCNIGNPQAFRQKPLTYIRQILSLVEYPELLSQARLLELYPKDMADRARNILTKNPHGTGAYTQSPGLPFIRQAVADFIHKRDGIPASKDHIIMTDGASKGAQAVLVALLKKPNDGFMIPIPQYPLYSASLALYGGKQIGYFLDEQNHWQLNEEVLSESLTEARVKGINAVGIVVINPSNPTGAVLSYDNIKMIIGFAKRNSLSIIADEVYQENVYAETCKFYSFAKAMYDLGDRETSLFSLHSVSKGFFGECGHRGGYLELRNVPDDVLAEFIKLQSINLCSNVPGQLTTYMMVSPPKPGDESYQRYVSERNAVLRELKEKAEILGRGISHIEGMSVEVPQGAMYAFVRFELPAEKDVDIDSMTPPERRAYEGKRDSEYCLALLEETGICVVPGSGFGQIPGTLHFRTTFLPPKEEIEDLVAKLKAFHANYTKTESLALTR
jgi:aspartate/methionine/tyrosine aminotransferase